MSASSAPSVGPTSSSQASVSSSIASSVTSAILSSLTNNPPSPPTTTPVNTVTAPPPPPTTAVFTSIITQPPPTDGQTSADPVTVIVTISSTPTDVPGTFKPTTATSSTSSKSSGAVLQGGDGGSSGSGGGGLSVGGKTAIAVVIPIVAIALLVLAGLLLWRRRKQKQAAEEARRKEMEDYGFNPNNDPTLPAVGLADGSEMTEDQSGYRGWGNTTVVGAATTRKTSTTLSGGVPGYSDAGSQPGGHHSPGSPTGGYSENSGDPLMGQPRELDSETVGALGAGPIVGQARSTDIRRGPSNASSRYSTGNQSEHSSEPPVPMSNPQDYYENAYYQPGPYGGGYQRAAEQPVIRDVSARRNTRIENPTVFPQQGNMGIAQNF